MFRRIFRSDFSGNYWQARHKSYFVEEIGEVLEWAGLDHGYGDHTSVCAAWTVFLKISFIGPATGGPNHPYFQAWFRIEDIFLLELTVTLARHVPDTRQEVHQRKSTPFESFTSPSCAEAGRIGEV